MASGQSAGFAKGLAKVLTRNRATQDQTARDQADRDFQVNLATFQVALEKGTESGDYTMAEKIFEEINGEAAKALRQKGGIAATIGPILQASAEQEAQQGARGSAAIESAPDAGAGPLGPRAAPGPAEAAAAARPGEAIVATEDQNRDSMVNRLLEMFGIPPMGGGPTTPLPGPGGTPPIAAEDTPATRLPRPAGDRPTLFGTPWGISYEERQQRAKERGIQQQMVTFEARRQLAERMDLVGQEAQEFILYGSRTPAGAQPGGDDFSLSPGQRRYNAEGNLIAEGGEAAASARSGFSLSPDQTRYDAEGNVIAARGPKPKEGAVADPATAARARLVSRNPELMQGWTNSAREEVMGVIAQDPVLHLEYVQSVSKGPKALATELTRSLRTLLDVNTETGKVLGLSAGGATLWGPHPGERIARFGRAHGREAAASLAQITSQEVLAEMARMKAQSPTGATGFGQLNIAELELLISAATVLQNRGASDIGEERALKELTSIYDRLQLITDESDLETELKALIAEGVSPEAGAAGAGSGGAPSGYTMDDQGNIIDASGNIVSAGR